MHILLDGRPTQAGFKRHKHRGTGKVAEMILKHLPDALPHAELSVLLDRSRSVEPFLFSPRYRRVVHCVPGWFSLNDEKADTHLYLPFTLDAVRCDAVHYFAHMDAPFWHVHPNTIVTVLDVIPRMLPDLYRPERNAFYKIYQRLLGRVVHRAKLVMTISEHSKKDIVSCFGIPEEKVHAVPLGVDPVFHPVANPSVRKTVLERYGIRRPYVFYVGGIDPRKNVARMIRAFQSFMHQTDGTSNRSEPFTLVLAGNIHVEPEFPDLEKTVRVSGLEGRVRFIGFVPMEDLPVLYGSAEIFLFPSLYEGFGIPPLEAMACGTAVIASNTSCLPEVVGDAGLMTDPLNAGDWTKAMLNVVGHREFRQRLIERGLKQAKKFTWEKTAEKTAAQYRKIIGSAHS